jgi:uncharacterized protein YndB with AHSA1/START domain
LSERTIEHASFSIERAYEVPPARIVYTYEMLLDETRISVSLTTVELEDDGA